MSTPEEQAHAIALYQEHGPSEASRRCGIPKATIIRWAKDGPTAGPVQWKQVEGITPERRARLGERWMRLAERKVDACLEGKGSATDEKAWATTAAIATDKAQLLSGQATSRADTLERTDHIRRLIESAIPDPQKLAIKLVDGGLSGTG